VKTGVVVLFHGSSTEGSGDMAQRIVNDVTTRGKFDVVEKAFLQYGMPDFHEAIAKCVHHKATNIIIVPFFLQTGVHVTKDIPDHVDRVKRRWPDLKVSVTDAVGSHRLMVDVVLSLIGETIDKF
jgi:sirohydrochlorin ferrochelatase